MVDVRVIDADGRVASRQVFERSLGEDFGEDGRAAWHDFLAHSRTLGSFVGERQVATATAFAAELTVPGGGLVDVHAVTGVGTLPTHARRGHARALLQRQVAEAREAGVAACVLHASEAPIYGRFGYGAATTRGAAVVQAARARFAVPPRVGGQIVDAVVDADVDADADGAEPPGGDGLVEVVGPLFDRWRRTRPGQLGRPAHLWALTLADVAAWRGGGHGLQWALHVDEAGTRDGYVAYRIRNRWDEGLPASEARIEELVAEDPEVRAALFGFVAGLPLVERVRLAALAEDEPLMHRLEDPRRVRTVQRGDGLWVRLVDVPGALGARHWWSDDRLVVEVTDDLVPEVAGRWQVVADGGRAEVASTRDEPDLRLGVAELGMLWLGGVTARTLVDAGRVAAASPDVVGRATRLFRGEVQPGNVAEF